MVVFAQVILSIVACLTFVGGMDAVAGGTSAIHQTLAAVYFLTFTVAMTGLGLLAAATRREVAGRALQQPQPLRAFIVVLDDKERQPGEVAVRLAAALASNTVPFR